MTAGREVRVLSVIGGLSVGGTETYLARIAPEVRKHGVVMDVLALDAGGPRRSDLERDGIRVYGTPYPERSRRSNTLTLLRTIDRIRDVVRRGRYDAVHTYLYWSDVLGVPAARLAGCRRVIVSRRAMHAWAHSGTRLFHGFEQTANALAHEVVANSNAVLRDAEEHEGRLPKIRTVIYNGIDVDRYQPARPGPAETLRVLTVGALAPRKGHAFAIEAMRMVASAGVEATLTIVGSGPDEPALRRQAADSGLGPAVDFRGEVVDPRPYLERADLFVLASRQEGFSNAILEAMASALPVVATDVGGNAEAVVDGEGGFIVEPESPQALASRIETLARDGSRRRAMGEFNRRRAREVFGLEASARSLAGWYLSGPRLGR